jgi:hypothetical protein
MFSFDVITNIQCVCGENGVSGRLQVDTSTHRQMYDTVVLPQSNETSLSARIRQCFATELAEGYRCPDCKMLSTLQHRTTLRRTICLLPEYLMVSLASPALRSRRHHVQRPSGLCKFVHLDLSGIASGGGPARSQYTLCAAILFRDQHYWTYLHGPTVICINDSRSRPATQNDLLEVAQCARILLYRQDSSSRTAGGTNAPQPSAHGATRREEELEGGTRALAPPPEEDRRTAGAPGGS